MRRAQSWIYTTIIAAVLAVIMGACGTGPGYLSEGPSGNNTTSSSVAGDGGGGSSTIITETTTTQTSTNSVTTVTCDPAVDPCGCSCQKLGQFCNPWDKSGTPACVAGACDESDPVSSVAWGINLACSYGVGQCKGLGTVHCDGSESTFCTAQAKAPKIEVCDGLDNDCDGVTDNDPNDPNNKLGPGGGVACNTKQPGVCAAGLTVCQGGQIVCNPSTPATTETCDGLDNDCDGVVDNGNPGGGLPCDTGLPGVCAPGTTVCTGGQIDCVQNVQPSAETCDGLDNDCDGHIDNDITCVCTAGQTQKCYHGPANTKNVGACVEGTSTCNDQGQWGPCMGEVLPSAETCDGLDNDCNNHIDDGLGTISCGVGTCVKTVPACTGGQPTSCTPGAAGIEICDGLDNDCNGLADDGNPGGGAACNTGKNGICAAGITACQGGKVVCIQTHQPSAETCNGLDDDCDGTIDNGNPGSGTSCATTKLGACAVGVTACQNGGIACQQTTFPSAEVCDGLDNDCNGTVDNGIVCGGGGNCAPNGATQNCYTGAVGTQNIGICHGGTQTCIAGNWGSCSGQQLPAASEDCSTPGDDNCNGAINEGCAITTCAACLNTWCAGPVSNCGTFPVCATWLAKCESGQGCAPATPAEQVVVNCGKTTHLGQTGTCQSLCPGM